MTKKSTKSAMRDHVGSNAETNSIQLEYGAIAHRAVGTGPDLLFIHGWPLDGRTWRHIVPELSRQFRCHVIDLPGTGQTRWSTDGPIGFHEHAETVCAVIEALGLDAVGLVSHDSGGAIARLVAATIPNKITGLVMGNTEIPGFTPWRIGVVQLAQKLPGAGSAMRTMLRSRLLRRLPFMLGDCFGDRKHIDGEFFELFCRPMIDSDAVFAGQMRFAANIDHDVLNSLDLVHARINAPVRLVWGDRDPWFPLKKCLPMSKQFAGAVEVATLPGGKLFAHEEMPHEFARHTREHFSSLYANESNQKGDLTRA